ncbi:hypothetical protein TW78_14635 [Vibrio coralliilyticus]|jgi:hypothetical protein|uniref:Orphan protein n=1 Tax=Vibrio coralliilyticus TaxID=190893 RepID=A0A837GCX2_9VIBR|nr:MULTISPECIES: hypothetical protein [Vibrio]KJY70706.1 hypothetical protein TW78_14635 [Vibrio coralliilyticus]MCC2523793.1 hypothetical protein [Vibrio coralliilyticus]NOH55849.1 hypothetical protein [Vibrio coralliilyticus]NOI58150.1 hypothetical protein [Vibrio coralliilyticus]NOJ23546.1 hypothetical protein [Vibrio coralliilyticus]
MFAQPTRTTFKTLLTVSNIGLVVTFLALVVSVLISYPYANAFSLNAQIAAHISTIVIAAFLKVSYVTRCLAQYNLGLEVK